MCETLWVFAVVVVAVVVVEVVVLVVVEVIVAALFPAILRWPAVACNVSTTAAGQGRADLIGYRPIRGLIRY